MHLQSLTLEQVPSFLVSLSQDISYIKDNLQKPAGAESIEPPIDVQEATDFVRLENVQTMYRMVREGRVPFHKRGSRLFFYKSELNSWIRGAKPIAE
jgi:excisionase family DNA binding protein